MLILDKIYIFIYWSVSKRLNPEKTTIWALNYLLFPILSGFLVFVLSVILRILSINIALPIIILSGILTSFFLSEKFIESYYTDKRQKRIIENNNKPGYYRYIVFLLIVLLSLIFMILFFVLSGMILD